MELSANRITTGTLSVERLIIVGNEQSIVYTINEANGTPQLSQNTIDGGSLTQRSITADRIVAGAITANEIAAATILANNIAAGAITTEKIAAEAIDASKIKAGVITTSHVASNFGETLDLSSNTSIRNTITQNVDEALADIEIGGVNLIRDSETYTLVADGADTYWIAADELEPGMTYTFSVRENNSFCGAGRRCDLESPQPHGWRCAHLRPTRLHLWQAIGDVHAPGDRGQLGAVPLRRRERRDHRRHCYLPQGHVRGRQYGDVMERRPRRKPLKRWVS